MVSLNERSFFSTSFKRIVQLIDRSTLESTVKYCTPYPARYNYSDAGNVGGELTSRRFKQGAPRRTNRANKQNKTKWCKSPQKDLSWQQPHKSLVTNLALIVSCILLPAPGRFPSTQYQAYVLRGTIHGQKNQARSARNFMETHSSHVRTGSPLA